MSDCPPPGVAENSPVRRPETLTPEGIERILADFRAWLEPLAQAPVADQIAPARDEEQEPIDLFTLLSQLTALRHEVHLQTRSSRTQQEQQAQALEHLATALDALRETQDAPQEESPEGELLRPLLKTLVDLYDALALANREVQRAQEAIRATLVSANSPENSLAETTAEVGTEGPDERIQYLLNLVKEWETTSARSRKQGHEPSGLLARWLGWGRSESAGLAAKRDALAAEGKVLAALRETLADHSRRFQEKSQGALQELEERTRQMMEAVLTGYAMSLQRVDRALRQQQLEPISCVGQPFDPERMEVLELATGTGRPSGEVVDEVRRGYVWRDRVFRFAQVRVAKS